MNHLASSFWVVATAAQLLHSFSSLMASVLLVCAALPGKGLLGSRAMFHYNPSGMKASTMALDFQLPMPSCQKSSWLGTQFSHQCFLEG